MVVESWRFTLHAQVRSSSATFRDEMVGPGRSPHPARHLSARPGPWDRHIGAPTRHLGSVTEEEPHDRTKRLSNVTRLLGQKIATRPIGILLYSSAILVFCM